MGWWWVQDPAVVATFTLHSAHFELVEYPVAAAIAGENFITLFPSQNDESDPNKLAIGGCSQCRRVCVTSTERVVVMGCDGVWWGVV